MTPNWPGSVNVDLLTPQKGAMRSETREDKAIEQFWGDIARTFAEKEIKISKQHKCDRALSMYIHTHTHIN